jgi:hypothetical protein
MIDSQIKRDKDQMSSVSLLLSGLYSVLKVCLRQRSSRVYRV